LTGSYRAELVNSYGFLADVGFGHYCFAQTGAALLQEHLEI
jgi:hypothetical protein